MKHFFSLLIFCVQMTMALQITSAFKRRYVEINQDKHAIECSTEIENRAKIFLRDIIYRIYEQMPRIQRTNTHLIIPNELNYRCWFLESEMLLNDALKDDITCSRLDLIYSINEAATFGQYPILKTLLPLAGNLIGSSIINVLLKGIDINFTQNCPEMLNFVNQFSIKKQRMNDYQKCLDIILKHLKEQNIKCSSIAGLDFNYKWGCPENSLMKCIKIYLPEFLICLLRYQDHIEPLDFLILKDATLIAMQNAQLMQNKDLYNKAVESQEIVEMGQRSSLFDDLCRSHESYCILLPIQCRTLLKNYIFQRPIA